MGEVGQYPSHQPVSPTARVHEYRDMFRQHLALADKSDRRVQLIVDNLDLLGGL